MKEMATFKYAKKDKEEKDIIEELSGLEHNQWMKWAKDIEKTEKITPERVKRWHEDCYKPYDKLTEKLKEFDREWARKVLKIVKKYYKE